MNTRTPLGYRLIVFDWDGTLVDSHARIVSAVGQALDQLGLPQRDPGQIRDVIGLSLAPAFERLFPELDASEASAFIDRYRRLFSHEGAAASPLFPGVRSTLQALRSHGYWLALATGKSRRGLHRELKATRLESLFSGSRSADEALSKPHPQMLLDLMAEFDVHPKETLMVGDTEFDLEMARNAGTRSVAVSYGAHSPERLLQFDPLDCMNSIAELPGLLRGVGHGN